VLYTSPGSPMTIERTHCAHCSHCVHFLERPLFCPRGVLEYEGSLRGLQVGTCESFFFRSNRIFESNRPYTPQAVTQPNGLQVYRTRRTACYTYSDYLIHRYFVFVTNENDVWTTELRTEYLFTIFQFSHKTRQTMLLYAYFTPKVDFKRKFNHHQSFLYEWRLTERTIRKFRIGPSIRIESRSFAGP